MYIIGIICCSKNKSLMWDSEFIAGCHILVLDLFQATLECILFISDLKIALNFN